MAVGMLNIPQMHEAFRDELAQALIDVMDSGNYIGGPKLIAFEEQLAAYCDVPHAIGVSSGSDALIAVLMALDIGSGDEIITTPFTFFSTAGAITRVGATPVFVDIEHATFNIDPRAIENAVTDKTAGIIPVSLYGQTPNMDAIEAIAKQHGVWVMEDAAQSIGAKYKDRFSGSFGQVGTFSFFPAKNIGCLGDGGAAMTSDEQLADKIRLMRNHGAEERYFYRRIGGNFRLDSMQAAALSVKLPHLKTWENLRRANAEKYNAAFDFLDDIQPPHEAEHCYHVYNQYVIRVLNGKRDELKKALDEKGIANAIYYPLCLHQQVCFADLGYKIGDFPVSEQAADEVLALPIMTHQADEVIAAMQGVFS